MDNATAATIYFDFMMKGQVNKISGEYTISKIDGEESNTHTLARVVAHPRLAHTYDCIVGGFKTTRPRRRRTTAGLAHPRP